MITSHDHIQITQLLKNSGKSGMLHELEGKLNQLSKVDPVKAPHDLVTMNTIIVFRDSQTNLTHELRLVYQLSPLYKNQVSVMAPLGTALLGSRENSTVVYEGRDALTRIIFIEKIKYQPEASGKLD